MLAQIEPDQTAPIWSTRSICSVSAIFVSKATQTRVQESDNELLLKTLGRSMKQPVDIRPGVFQKLTDGECITFEIGVFQLIIVTGIVPDHWGQM